jgi:hypothetical protein
MTRGGVLLQASLHQCPSGGGGVNTFGLAPDELLLDNDTFLHALLGVHEAGHAVCAQDLGYEVANIELFSNSQGHGGHTSLATRTMRADDVVLFALAGLAAERRWLREMTRHGLDDGLFRLLCSDGVSIGDQHLLNRGLDLSRYRGLQEGFADASEWAERRLEAVQELAARVMTQCSCMRSSTKGGARLIVGGRR